MEEHTNSFEEESRLLAERYEKQADEDAPAYFESDEFEVIIEHYLRIGNFRKALEVAELGCSQFPYAAIFMLKKAMLVSLLDSSYEESMQLLNQALIFEPTNPDIYEQMAVLHEDNGNTDEALACYDQAISYGGNIEDIIFAKAYIFEDNEKYKEAIFCLEEILIRDPQNFNAIYELAYCYDYLDQTEKSIELYLKFIDFKPYSADAWFNVGLLYSRLEKYTEAIQAYEYATFADKKYVSAYANMGQVYILLEKFDMAISCLEEAIKIFPENSSYYCQIANCYKLTEQYEDSRHFFRKAMELDDKNAEAWYGMGLSYFFEDRLNQAMFYLKKSVALAPDQDNYWSNIGHCALEMGELELCEQAYKKAYELGNEADSFEYLKDYVYALHLMDKYDEAIALVREAIEEWDNHPHLLMMLAGLLYATGRLEQGDDLFELALGMNPKSYHVLFEYFEEQESNAHLWVLIGKYQA